MCTGCIYIRISTYVEFLLKFTRNLLKFTWNNSEKIMTSLLISLFTYSHNIFIAVHCPLKSKVQSLVLTVVPCKYYIIFIWIYFFLSVPLLILHTFSKLETINVFILWLYWYNLRVKDGMIISYCSSISYFVPL